MATRSLRHSERWIGRSLSSCYSAFSLIELLVVIAVIGIMSTLIITTIMNASRDSRWTIARQQQAALQTALGSWVSKQGSVVGARDAYQAADSVGKLGLLSNYVQPDTFADFMSSTNSTATSIGSRILDQLGYRLVFSPWTETNNPSVQLSANPR